MVRGSKYSDLTRKLLVFLETDPAEERCCGRNERFDCTMECSAEHNGDSLAFLFKYINVLNVFNFFETWCNEHS